MAKTKLKTETVKELKRKLAYSEKQSNKINEEIEIIRKKLEVTASKNKPKSIMHLVKSYEDACRYNKEKPVHVYGGKTNDTVDEIAYKRLKYVIKTLNEGYVFKMDVSEDRWFIWWELDSSSPSGLRFDDSGYYCDNVIASSAAHLSLKSKELALHSKDCPEIVSDYAKFLLGK